MSCVLFTDDIIVTLDEPDNWENGWVYFGDHQRLRRQQLGGEVMLCVGIIEDRLAGPVRVPEGFKVTAVTFNLLKEDGSLAR